MNLFELVPDESYDVEIEAEHRWGLPGVKCDACGATWSNVGVAYPAADLSRLPNSERYTNAWPVAWNEFVEIRNAVVPLLPPNAIAPPGTELGPLVGSARGTFPEIVWRNSWTMLMHGGFLDPIREMGIRPLVGGKAVLAGHQDLPEFVELQLEPHGRLDRESLGPTSSCTKCGRLAITRPSRVVIERASIPTDHDIFRLADLTTMVVATDRAIDVLTGLNLRGFRFQEAPLK